MTVKLEEMRQTYGADVLDETSAGMDPVALFAEWLRAAQDAGVREPNAMTVATVDAAGRPHARVVLLKGLVGDSFRFFTNTESDKGLQIRQNPAVALVFWWEPLERQVRIEGSAVLVSDGVADQYFAQRPHASRLGAWASAQSRPIESREALDRAWEEATLAQGEALTRPPFWGGYDVEATRMEFWQGRAGRLHDRLLYVRGEDGWSRCRLCP